MRDMYVKFQRTIYRNKILTFFDPSDEDDNDNGKVTFLSSFRFASSIKATSIDKNYRIVLW